MQRSQRPIAIYSRKSRFTGKGESIGNQIELCKEYICAHYGGECARSAVLFEDEGFSGGNLNRPAFKRMMKAAQEKRFTAIIVYRLDRISRNISDFSGLIEELSRLEIAFVSIREQFDTATPMGRAMMYIASVFSQLERETIAERIRDNMHELAKTGRWLGGITPTGYSSESVKSITMDGKTHKSCKLRLIPAQAQIVTAICQLFLETDSLTLTEAELMKRRIVTKNGRYFTRFSIKAILQNPVYAIADDDAYQYFISKGAEVFCDRSSFDGRYGVLAYRRTDQGKGRSTVYLPVSEWIICEGQHPGLIPGRTWALIQDRLEKNKSNAYRKPRRNDSLLTGLLWCNCGSRMYPKLSQHKTADGQTAFAYVCKMKQRSQRSLCTQRNLCGTSADAAAAEALKTLDTDNRAFVSRLISGRSLLSAEAPEYETQLAAFEQQRAENLRKLNGLIDSLAALSDGAARTLAAERIGQLDQAVQTLDERILQWKSQSTQCSLSPDRFDALCKSYVSFRECVCTMSVQQLRAAVQSLISSVLWDGTAMHVSLSAPWGEDSK